MNATDERRMQDLGLLFLRGPQTISELLTRSLQSIGEIDLSPNVISMRIQPDEGIALKFAAKVPNLRNTRVICRSGDPLSHSAPLAPGMTVSAKARMIMESDPGQAFADTLIVDPAP